jgi:hypothetical protein
MREPDRYGYHSYGFYEIGFEPEGCRWLAAIWPVSRESIFAIGSQNIGDNLDWSDATWHNRTFLELLLDSDSPLLEMAMFLLLNGLAAKEPGEHGLSVDVAIQAINDGRLGTDNLGRALLNHLPSNHFLLSRWSKRFADIANASELHGYVVFRAMEQGLRGDPKELPKGLGDILQMLNEIAAQLGVGVTDEDCRKFLEQFSGSNKSAKAAKALLAAPSETNSAAFVQQAIELRIERLNDWKARK